MLIEGFDFLYIAFQLTLFFLLCLILQKLLKQYLIPSIYTYIEDIKKKQKELRDKEKLLIVSQKRITKQIEEQESSFDILENKIKCWNNSLIEDKDKKIDDNKKLINKIEHKRKIQTNNLSLLKTQRIVIPESIKQAYKEIENLYGGEKSVGLLKELIEKIESEH